MEIRDQTYCYLTDGSIFSVHGDQNLAGTLTGDVAFVPDSAGTYTDGTGLYSKPYVHDSFRRSQSRSQPQIEMGGGMTLAVPGVGIDPREIVGVVTVEDMRASAMNGPHANTIEKLESFMMGLMPPNATNDVSFGLTGSIGLGLFKLDRSTPHDWDIVVSSDAATRHVLTRALQQRALSMPEVRVNEYGKGWLIRQWIDGYLLCPFFRDATPLLIQFKNIDPNVVSVVGEVVESTNSALVPVMFSIRDRLGVRSDIVLLGLRSRGDVGLGDEVQVTGRRCEVMVDESRSRIALLSVEDAPRLLSRPPWEAYYA